MNLASPPSKALTPALVRTRLVDALRLDLVGPTPDDALHAEEVLPEAPSKFYLTGFLVPHEGARQANEDETDEQLAMELGGAGADDDVTPEGQSGRRAVLPSSMGLSVLVPAGVASLEVLVRWADYEPAPDADPRGRALLDDDDVDPLMPWRRLPRSARLTVPVQTGGIVHHEVGGSGGLHLVVSARPVVQGTSVPAGTRAVSLFLVNERRPRARGRRDQAYVFQTGLEVSCPLGFVARPDTRGRDGNDWDEQVAELQFRDAFEFAVGHNASIHAHVGDGGQCVLVETTWLPCAEVEKVVPGVLSDEPAPPGREPFRVELAMEVLGEAGSPTALQALLADLPDAYEHWLDRQATRLPGLAQHKELGEALVHQGRACAGRIRAGIAQLSQPAVFDAWCISQQAMARANRQREAQKAGGRAADVGTPKWRPFQLAFLLMNLSGLADPSHEDRKAVDLLFFPTGGGKTEAYLGLAAFAMVHRRLTNPGLLGGGVSVLMRYTLRLLTLDQLGRAAGLVCALELARQAAPEKLGTWPFEIGLWVGRAATPNRMGKRGDGDDHSARMRAQRFMNDDKRHPSPIPLENCPWCGQRIGPKSFDLVPNAHEPNQLRVRCVNRDCEFTGNNPLPVQAVDEPIYRRLPAFVIATVDKFAGLPWVGQTGMLCGLAKRADAGGFYGPMDAGLGTPLDGVLPGPDLVIQDELHLISGPLGTMVGLYETALDALCSRKEGGVEHGPKIVASTATVRRATQQIQAIFGRSEVEIFPPPGPDRRDSFFARTVPTTQRNARMYVGVAALGRNPKVVLLRTYLALLGAAQKAWNDAGGSAVRPNPADPFMTLLGYFNALRELGGSRRIVEDEINARLSGYGDRRRVGESQGSFAHRKIDDLPVELTSRVSTSKVSDAKRCLELEFQSEDRVDVALATNMISVGLDINRLGLMVVLSQPKTAAEYIQATSRVGRDDLRPGLVVALLNLHRPRDRSHFERFEAWHQSFYRAVEATSVTPFSPRALERGLAAVVVALARHGDPMLTGAPRAAQMTTRRGAAGFVVDAVVQRARSHAAQSKAEEEALATEVGHLANELLDAWESIATENEKVAAGLQYGNEMAGAPPLLRDPLDSDLPKLSERARRFKAARSLRDVESVVGLYLRAPDGGVANTEEG